MSNEEITKRVEGDLAAVGAKLIKKYRHDKWDFYPHVSPEDFRSGFYPKIEALQGQNNTYIVGEILSAATVESVARYSCTHIQKYFSPRFDKSIDAKQNS